MHPFVHLCNRTQTQLTRNIVGFNNCDWCSTSVRILRFCVGKRQSISVFDNTEKKTTNIYLSQKPARENGYNIVG